MIQGTLWILGSLILLGVAAWLMTQKQQRDHNAKVARGEAFPEVEEQPDDRSDCCGMHIICERDSLLAGLSRDIVYYDDEELDAFVYHAADDYKPEEVEQFRDILLTLREDDVPGWLRSLQLRDIHLPEELLPDALLIVGERRIQQKHEA